MFKIEEVKYRADNEETEESENEYNKSGDENADND